jgi:hypothetical protein
LREVAVDRRDESTNINLLGSEPFRDVAFLEKAGEQMLGFNRAIPKIASAEQDVVK